MATSKRGSIVMNIASQIWMLRIYLEKRDMILSLLWQWISLPMVSTRISTLPLQLLKYLQFHRVALVWSWQPTLLASQVVLHQLNLLYWVNKKAFLMPRFLSCLLKVVTDQMDPKFVKRLDLLKSKRLLTPLRLLFKK